MKKINLIFTILGIVLTSVNLFAKPIVSVKEFEYEIRFTSEEELAGGFKVVYIHTVNKNSLNNLTEFMVFDNKNDVAKIEKKMYYESNDEIEKGTIFESWFDQENAKIKGYLSIKELEYWNFENKKNSSIILVDYTNCQANTSVKKTYHALQDMLPLLYNSYNLDFIKLNTNEYNRVEYGWYLDKIEEKNYQKISEEETQFHKRLSNYNYNYEDLRKYIEKIHKKNYDNFIKLGELLDSE